MDKEPIGMLPGWADANAKPAAQLEAALVASTPLATPEGITAGIYLIATRWLAPIAATAINVFIDALVVTATQAFRKEYRISAANIFSAYTQLLAILTGTSGAYGVPLAGGFDLNETDIAALITALGGL